MRYDLNGGMTIEEEHTTCNKKGEMEEFMVGQVKDVSAEMRELIYEHAIVNYSKGSSEVARWVFDTTASKYDGTFL